MTQQIMVEPVRADFHAAALAFLRQGNGCASVAADFVWARRGEQIVAVAGVCPPAGRVVDVMLPGGSARLTVGDGKAILSEIDMMLGRHRSVYFAQALLPAHDGYWGELMLSGGFRQIATIDLLAALPDSRDIGARLRFAEAENLSKFGELVRATWHGSQDCRDLVDHRTVDDLIAEYRSRCDGDLTHWYVVQFDHQTVGGLIVNTTASADADSDPIEAVYWGLLPPFRGRGFGDEILRFIRRIAAREGRMVTAVVDQRNAPALAAYHRNGFQTVDCRRLYVKYLRFTG